MTPFSLRHFDDPSLFGLAAPQTVKRGRSYFKSGRVIRVTLKRPDLAVCDVDGDTGTYTRSRTMTGSRSS